MGYSKSKSSVKLVSEILEIIKKEESDFKLPSGDPTRLAQRIRNAYYVIEEVFPKEFAGYLGLRKKFILKVEQTCITFQRNHELISGQVERITPAGLGVANYLEIPEAVTALQVVGALIKHKAAKMIFTSIDSSSNLYNDVEKWTKKNGYYISSLDPFTVEKL